MSRLRLPTARMTAAAPAEAIEAALAELGLTYENPRPGAYLVKLEGQHKLATMTWLIVGAHSLAVEAFFCRQPDENHAAFYRFLLERNGRMYGVHFSLDPVGDVYLTGRLPLTAVTARRRSTGCSAACSATPTRTSTLRWNSASPPRSGGNGPGGSSAARAWPTCAPSPGSPTPTADLRAVYFQRAAYSIARITGILLSVNRLGELERAIMEVLWESDAPLTVREVSARLTERDLAHTTVMTVLDRLAKKGFARRQRDGRAWRYCPAATRETYVDRAHADRTGPNRRSHGRPDPVRPVGFRRRGRGAAARPWK